MRIISHLWWVLGGGRDRWNVIFWQSEGKESPSSLPLWYTERANSRDQRLCDNISTDNGWIPFPFQLYSLPIPIHIPSTQHHNPIIIFKFGNVLDISHSHPESAITKKIELISVYPHDGHYPWIINFLILWINRANGVNDSKQEAIIPKCGQVHPLPSMKDSH